MPPEALPTTIVNPTENMETSQDSIDLILDMFEKDNQYELAEQLSSLLEKHTKENLTPDQILDDFDSIANTYQETAEFKDVITALEQARIEHNAATEQYDSLLEKIRNDFTDPENPPESYLRLGKKLNQFLKHLKQKSEGVRLANSLLANQQVLLLSLFNQLDMPKLQNEVRGVKDATITNEEMEKLKAMIGNDKFFNQLKDMFKARYERMKQQKIVSVADLEEKIAFFTEQGLALQTMKRRLTSQK